MKSILKMGKYLKKYQAYIYLSLLSALINVGLTLYIPIVIGKGIDEIGNNNFDKVITNLIIIFICLIIASVFNYLYELFTAKLTQNSIKDLRDELFIKINYLPIKYLDTHAHGDVVSKVTTDVELVGDGLLQGFKQLYRGLIMIFATIGFMLYLNWIIAIVVVVLTPLSLFIASFVTKKTHKMYASLAKTKGEIGSYTLEIISGQKIIKGMNYEQKSIETFQDINDRLYEVGQKAQLISATTNPSTRLVNSIVYAAVGVIGAILIIERPEMMSVGTLTAFLSYANQYTKPFNEITGVIVELQTAVSSLNRIFEVLEHENEIDNGNKEITNVEKIEIENLFFSYREDQQLIENFNLKVSKGQKVAIVGPTGCGKTTIINLLLRFYDPKSGDIKINDISIKDLKRKVLRDNYGMVLQDTWIFKGTVFDNIAYGKDGATFEEVKDAATRSHAIHFIERLPQGFDTVISESSGLSHGEKQLITIARLMINIPDVVILDEATSSIDTRTEIKISEAFKTIMEGRTSFVIAHRLSTIQNADLILVMKDGHVVEQGNHNELLKEHGFYYQIYHSQFDIV